MKISFVIPIYNQGKYLHACLSALQAQTLPDIEFILVNDGSSDDSVQIIETFLHDDRFVLVNQPNCGAATARNTGIRIAKGEYLSFVDSDDVICNRFSEQMHALAMDTGADIVVGVKRMFDDDEPFIQPASVCLTAPQTLSPLETIRYGYSCCGKLFKKSLLLPGPLFPDGVWAEDNGFTPYLYAKASYILLYPAAVYGYRRHPQSISGELRSLTDVPKAILYLATLCRNDEALVYAATESLTNAVLGYAQHDPNYFRNIAVFLNGEVMQSLLLRLRGVMKFKYMSLFSMRQKLYFIQMYMFVHGYPIWCCRALYLYNYLKSRRKTLQYAEARIQG